MFYILTAHNILKLQTTLSKIIILQTWATFFSSLKKSFAIHTISLPPEVQFAGNSSSGSTVALNLKNTHPSCSLNISLKWYPRTSNWTITQEPICTSHNIIVKGMKSTYASKIISLSCASLKKQLNTKIVGHSSIKFPNQLWTYLFIFHRLFVIWTSSIRYWHERTKS